MADAAGLFTGMHDYVSFSSDSPEEKSTKVQILDSVVEVSGDLILIRIHGSHFLWNQVRRMVGALVEVGRGTRSPDDIRRYLSETSSEPAKMTAPPSGLFLERVFYSREAELPEGPPLIWVG
jgi:tRNA pseudouridine38-40 synthase